MSRRYCDVCGERHNNAGIGVCDKHLDYHAELQRQKDAEFQKFMELDEQAKWLLIWDKVLAS